MTGGPGYSSPQAKSYRPVPGTPPGGKMPGAPAGGTRGRRPQARPRAAPGCSGGTGCPGRSGSRPAPGTPVGSAPSPAAELRSMPRPRSRPPRGGDGRRGGRVQHARRPADLRPADAAVTAPSTRPADRGDGILATKGGTAIPGPAASRSPTTRVRFPRTVCSATSITSTTSTTPSTGSSTRRSTESRSTVISRVSRRRSWTGSLGGSDGEHQ